MDQLFVDEELWDGEIPVEADFLLENVANPVPVSDPLQFADPLQGEQFLEQPVDNLCDPVEEKFVAEPVTPTPSPPKSLILGGANEFTVEMVKKVDGICQEAIYLFSCDPREYHPFYLTADECIKTGLAKGFVKPCQVHKIWAQLSNLAKERFAGKRSALGFTGEKSKYAECLLEKKTVSGSNWQRRFAQLAKVGNKIRAEGLKRCGGNLKDDLTTKLAFFNECSDLKMPELCYQVNPIWKELLKEKEKRGQRIVKILTKARTGGIKETEEAKKKGDKQSKERKREENVPTKRGKKGLGEVKKTNSRQYGKKRRKSPVRLRKVAEITNNSEDIQTKIDPNLVLDPETESAITAAIVELENEVEMKPELEPEVAPTPTLPPKPVQIPLRKRVKRRKFPVPVEPKPLKPVKLVKKRTKAAMGIRRALKKPLNTSDRLAHLEKMLNQPKDKLMVVTKEKKKVKGKRTLKAKKILKTAPSVSTESEPLKPPEMNQKPTGKNLKKKKKAIKMLKGNKRGVDRQARLEQIMLKKTFGIRKQKKESTTSTKVPPPENSAAATVDDIKTQLSKTPAASKKKVALKKTKAAAKRKSEKPVEITSSAPTTLTTQVINVLPKQSEELASAAMEVTSAPIQDSFNDVNDFSFSPPPASPDNNDDFEDFPDVENSAPPEPLNPQNEQEAASPEPEENEELTIQNESNKILRKYKEDTVKCTLCQQHISFYNFSVHLRLSHNHFEELLQCPECPRQFRRRDCWLFHIEVDHKLDEQSLSKLVTLAKEVNPKPIMKHAADPSSTQEKCDICQKNFNSDYLAFHKMLIHSSQNNILKCPMCPDRKYERKHAALLWLHYCSNHAEGTPLETLYPVERRNKLNISSNNPGTCPQCGVSLTSQANVTRHLQTVHGIGDGSDNQWPCITCGKMFKSKDNMYAHYRRLHEGSVISKCPKCSRDCQTSGKLWTHMVEAHKVTAAEAGTYCGVDWCLCEYCGVEVLVDRQYGNHVKSAHPDQYEDYRAKQKSKPRIRKRPALERERCRIRKKERRLIHNKLSSMSSLTLTADAEDTGKCPECGVFIETGLISHRQIVHGVIADKDAHLCQVDGCQKPFRFVKDLMIHMRHSHTAEIQERIQEKMVIRVMEETEKFAVFQCTLCNMCMSHSEEVKVHCVVNHPELFSDLWGEINGTQRTCPHCETSWGKVSELRKHVIESHPETTWKCETCGSTALDMEEFERHWEVEHAQRDLWYRVSKKFIGAIGATKRCIREAALKGDGQLAEDSSEEPQGKLEKSKWAHLGLKCVVCGQIRSADGFAEHLRLIHGIVEDLDGLECNICTEKPLYKYTRRDNWVCHMALFHKVGEEELRRVAEKIYTQQDWKIIPGFRNKKISDRWAKMKNNTEEKDLVETREKRQVHDEETRKYASMKIECQMCSKTITVGGMGRHLVKVHAVEEDKAGLFCMKCPKRKFFKWMSRANWFRHMAIEHGEPEETLIQQVSRVQTEEDCRKMTEQDLQAAEKDGEEKDLAESKKKERVTDAERRRYGAMEVKCEVCKQTRTIAGLGPHLLGVHGIEEDKGGLICDKCPRQKVYMYTCRSNWLHHMASVHSEPVVELIKEVCKVHTVVDWRDLNVKNPAGVKNDDDTAKSKSKSRSKKKSSGTKRKTSLPRSNKRKRSKLNSDGSDSDNDNGWSSEEDEKESESEENLEVDMRRKVHNTRTRNRAGHKSLREKAEELERHKKLVISVERLAENEIIKWRKKTSAVELSMIAVNVIKTESESIDELNMRDEEDREI